MLCLTVLPAQIAPGEKKIPNGLSQRNDVSAFFLTNVLSLKFKSKIWGQEYIGSMAWGQKEDYKRDPSIIGGDPLYISEGCKLSFWLRANKFCYN